MSQEKPMPEVNMDQLLLTIALVCILYVVLKATIKDLKTLSPAIPPEYQQAYDRYTAQERFIEERKRKNDPNSPEYEDPYKEEKSWPLLTKDNEPADGQCVYMWWGDGSYIAEYKRATESYPAILEGEGAKIIVRTDLGVHWKPCEQIP